MWAAVIKLYVQHSSRRNSKECRGAPQSTQARHQACCTHLVSCSGTCTQAQTANGTSRTFQRQRLHLLVSAPVVYGEQVIGEQIESTVNDEVQESIKAGLVRT